jgi:predicted lysophospholipase L1 biosynthesis ABC-type transport system permease subunit
MSWKRMNRQERFLVMVGKVALFLGGASAAAAIGIWVVIMAMR